MKDKNAPYGCLHSRMHLDSALEEPGSELVEEKHKGKDEQSQEVEGACQRLDGTEESGGRAHALTPPSSRPIALGGESIVVDSTPLKDTCSRTLSGLRELI